MEARNGSDPHRSGSNMPKIGETDFPTFQMLLTAFMMRHNGVYEAFETEIPEDESEEDAWSRLATHGKGNQKAYSYLVEACYNNKTAILIIRSVVNRDKTTWANSIMKELKVRFSEHAADVLQKLISEFNSLTMIFGEKSAQFTDRVKDKVNCITEIDANETPTEAQIMARVKEGIKFAHPSLHDLLDLIELDYSSFMSKVEKYNKPNLIVAEKVVASVEKETVPSANFSSYDQRNAQEPERNWKTSRKDCFACGSNKHFVRDCKFKDEYYENQKDEQRSEAFFKKSKNRPVLIVLFWAVYFGEERLAMRLQATRKSSAKLL